MTPVAKGECEMCPTDTIVDLFVVPGSVFRLCAKHYQDEFNAVESSKKINVVADSLKKIDNTQLKADIYNAATTSFVELHAAIQHDDEIPADKKNEVLVQTVGKYITGFTEAIFSLQEQKVAKENEREGWRQATVDFIAKLRTEEREKYAKFNVTYAPPVVTKKAIKGSSKGAPKTTANKQPKVVVKMHDLKIAAIKYGVAMSTLQGICELRNIDVDTAGKMLSAAFGNTPTGTDQ
jgi:hypothetical protein